VADHLSTWLFAPTEAAVINLKTEGIERGVHQTGDVMYDAFLALAKIAGERSGILTKLQLNSGDYSLLTLHRAENTDDPGRLKAILNTLNQLNEPLIFPIHPRTREKLKEYHLDLTPQALQMVEPVGYFDMLNLELNAHRIFTDSGGVQKEAYMAKVPCITLRDETEWVETVAAKWNRLVGADPAAIKAALDLKWVGTEYPALFGEGDASEKIVQILTGKSEQGFSLK
jgi:UDP-N-acetylglucosamine 2-epimerase